MMLLHQEHIGKK